MMQQDGLLGKADQRAQRRFHAALGAYFATGSWATRETALYLEGEKLAKDLAVEADWERAKAEFDALQDADHDYHFYNGVQVADCDDCWTMYEPGMVFDFQSAADLRDGR